MAEEIVVKRRGYYFIRWGETGCSTFVWPIREAKRRARRMDEIAMRRGGKFRHRDLQLHWLERFQGSEEELDRLKWPFSNCVDESSEHGGKNSLDEIMTRLAQIHNYHQQQQQGKGDESAVNEE